MNTFERNIVNSFQRVRKDMLEIKNQLLMIAESQERQAVEIGELKEKNGKSTNTIVRTIKTVRPKTAKKTFVAAKEGKKFHITACPYAKNIKPISKLTFKSKDAALNKGFKPCTCVK
ncbi:MAG: hypothetical protein ABIH37_05450 [archaeon]